MVWSSAICNPTVAMASGASGQKKWSNVDLFDAYFRRADLDRDDQISGNGAVAFFQGSGLPKQVLAQFREGRPLPAVLPSNVMFDLSNIFQPANNHSNAGNVAWRPASGFQQQQPMPGFGARHMATPAGGRPPKTVAPSHAEENQQANQQKPRVPELEKHLENQLSIEEVNSLNSKFKEATEADKKGT